MVGVRAAARVVVARVVAMILVVTAVMVGVEARAVVAELVGKGVQAAVAVVVATVVVETGLVGMAAVAMGSGHTLRDSGSKTVRIGPIRQCNGKSVR